MKDKRLGENNQCLNSATVMYSIETNCVALCLAKNTPFVLLFFVVVAVDVVAVVVDIVVVVIAAVTRATVVVLRQPCCCSFGSCSLLVLSEQGWSFNEKGMMGVVDLKKNRNFLRVYHT